MSNVFLILILISFPCLVVGIIKPSLVIRWGDPEKRNRKKVLATYLGLFVISFIAFGVTASKQDVATQQSQQTEQSQAHTAKKSEPTPEEIKKHNKMRFWHGMLG